MNFKVIGVSGKAGSGKDYITQMYLKPRGYYQVSFAWHFKIWVVSTGRATYEEVFYTKPPHVRELLQLEGTERGRQVFGENVWIDTAFSWMRLWNESWGIDKFVVPDIRFKNELFALTDRGFDVFRINAPGRVADSKLSFEQRQHISETDLDDVPSSSFKAFIVNDYGVDNDHLAQQIDRLSL